MLQILQIVSLIFVAIPMALSFAHAPDMLGKLRPGKDSYLAIQSIYCPGFIVGGVSELVGILATLALLIVTAQYRRILAEPIGDATTVLIAVIGYIGIYTTLGGLKMIKRYFLQVAVSMTALASIATAAFAAPSCSSWMRQPDGSQWRICVGDDGRQYCESAKNGQISRVSCR